MSQINSSIWNSVFDSFNRVLADGYQRVLEQADSEETLQDPEFQESLRASVMDGIRRWYSRPLTSGGDTPEQMICGLPDAEACMRVFRLASTRCDDDIPDLLKHRMKGFGTGMVDQLMTAAFSASWSAPDGADAERPEQLRVAIAAVRLLGEWQVSDAMDLMLSRYLSHAEPDEMMSEAFVSYCAGLGAPAVDPLVEVLLNAAAEKSLSGPYEYALVALTEAGKTRRSDRIFLCLRECFRAMDSKVIAAICLGDYGDGRAVPVLKGYVDREPAEMDRQLFYEILSSIRRLGGDISDIRDPFAGPGRGRTAGRH